MFHDAFFPTYKSIWRKLNVFHRAIDNTYHTHTVSHPGEKDVSKLAKHSFATRFCVLLETSFMTGDLQSSHEMFKSGNHKEEQTSPYGQANGQDISCLRSSDHRARTQGVRTHRFKGEMMVAAAFQQKVLRPQDGHTTMY